jgi:hypothetical protein
MREYLPTNECNDTPLSFFFNTTQEVVSVDDDNALMNVEHTITTSNLIANGLCKVKDASRGF